ncbi:MAG: hypothetical protein AAFQ51_12245 [Pseudomonadota bacterium]
MRPGTLGELQGLADASPVLEPLAALQQRADQRVAQRKPPPPEGAGETGWFYSLFKPSGLNFVNTALVYPGTDPVVRGQSALPLQRETLTLFDPGDAQIAQLTAGDTGNAFTRADFLSHGTGTFWAVGDVVSDAGTRVHSMLPIVVRHVVPAGGQALDAPIIGSTYLGSHWTSTTYDDSFAQNGILLRGEAQSRFGEGLYLTQNKAYGWNAAISKIQEIRAGSVAQWGVYLRPGVAFDGECDGRTIEGQFTDPPWTDKDLAHYINNFDTIYDPDEEEVKVNPRAFPKINIVKLGTFNPVSGKKL